MTRRTISKEQRQHNIEQIKIAIQTLKENQAEVSVKAISGLTGISAANLYHYSIVDPYKNTYGKHSAKLVCAAPVAKEQDTEELEEYLAVINEQYFHHPESVEDAMHDMILHREKFKASTFQQAINKLQATNQIAPVPNRPGTFNRGNRVFLPLPAPAPQPATTSAAQPVAVDSLPKVKANPYDRVYQLPLSNGKIFSMKFPSDITTEDSELIADFFNLIQARTLKR